MSNKHLTEQRFSDFSLAEPLLRGVEAAGFEFCTPIQAASLPPALEGKDIAGQAQTGTGKTVAFLLACCHHLLTNPAPDDRQPDQPRALILAPTRELAIQIYNDAEVLNQFTGLKLGLVYGGTGYDEQKKILQDGVDILIGTPGRLIDYHKQHLFNLKRAQVSIMDEADRMFDLGFIKDIRFLLRRMPEPENRLNLLFSATLSFRVMEMAYEHMNDPVEIKIDADVRVADKINEVSYYPSVEEKLPLLINLLNSDGDDRALVFVNTRIAADVVSQTLEANGISNAALSGEVPQKKRERLLDSFKQGETRILVATDVAARGLHIPEVKHVYNYDLPQDAEDYVHRIGRTARAGASGEAISFICEKYAYSIMEIEDYIGHPLPKLPVTSDLVSDIIRPRIDTSHRNKGRGGKGKPDGRNSGRNKPSSNHDKRKPDNRSANKSITPQNTSEQVMERADKITQTQAPTALPTSVDVSVAADSLKKDLTPAASGPQPSDMQRAKKEDTPTNKTESKIAAGSISTASTNLTSDDPQSNDETLKRVPNTVRFSRKFGEVPLIG